MNANRTVSREDFYWAYRQVRTQYNQEDDDSRLFTMYGHLDSWEIATKAFNSRYNRSMTPFERQCARQSIARVTRTLPNKSLKVQFATQMRNEFYFSF